MYRYAESSESDIHELNKETLLTREGKQDVNGFGVAYLNVNMEVRSGIKKHKNSFERKH
jgi:hypothetical protein